MYYVLYIILTVIVHVLKSIEIMSVPFEKILLTGRHYYIEICAYC